MPIRPCRTARHAHPAWIPLPGPEEALATILAAAAQPPVPETICLLLDPAHCGLGCVVVDGTTDDDAVYRVADFLVDVALERTSWARSSCHGAPGRSHLPSRPITCAFSTCGPSSTTSACNSSTGSSSPAATRRRSPSSPTPDRSGAAAAERHAGRPVTGAAQRLEGGAPARGWAPQPRPRQWLRRAIPRARRSDRLGRRGGEYRAWPHDGAARRGRHR